jgi:hypothetical protein
LGPPYLRLSDLGLTDVREDVQLLLASGSGSTIRNKVSTDEPTPKRYLTFIEQ